MPAVGGLAGNTDGSTVLKSDRGRVDMDATANSHCAGGPRGGLFVDASDSVALVASLDTGPMRAELLRPNRRFQTDVPDVEATAQPGMLKSMEFGNG